MGRVKTVVCGSPLGDFPGEDLFQGSDGFSKLDKAISLIRLMREDRNAFVVEGIAVVCRHVLLLLV